MTFRETVEEKIDFVLLYIKCENYEEVRRKWKNNFSSEASIASERYERFKEIGSVADLQRPGRPCTSKNLTCTRRPCTCNLQHLKEAQALNKQGHRTSVIAGAYGLDMSKASDNRLLN